MFLFVKVFYDLYRVKTVRNVWKRRRTDGRKIEKYVLWSVPSPLSFCKLHVTSLGTMFANGIKKHSRRLETEIVFRIHVCTVVFGPTGTMRTERPHSLLREWKIDPCSSIIIVIKNSSIYRSYQVGKYIIPSKRVFRYCIIVWNGVFFSNVFSLVRTVYGIHYTTFYFILLSLLSFFPPVRLFISVRSRQ